MRADRRGAAGIRGERRGVQFRISAGQVQRIGVRGRRFVSERRKVVNVGAECFEQRDIGRVDERKRGIARDGDFPVQKAGSTGGVAAPNSTAGGSPASAV